MPYCEDCGYGPTSNGICSACQEELYIVEFQSDVIEEPLSDEFMEKAAEQRRQAVAPYPQNRARLRRPIEAGHDKNSQQVCAASRSDLHRL